MNNEHITDEQRKQFADIVREAERRYDREFDGYFDSISKEIVPRIEARSRTRNLFDTVRSLKAKLSEALMQLRAQGYRVDDGMIAIDLPTRDDEKNELEELKRDAVQERNVKRAKFRKALFDLASLQTVDEARQLVEQVIG